MRILIAGGSGLIGTEIRYHLTKDNAVYNYDTKFNCTGNDMTGWNVDARIPLHKYLYPDVDAFIDCARYEKPSEQFITWNTVINHFKRQAKGKIILFSSIYGHKVPDFEMYANTEIEETPIEYAIWKAGTEHATRFLAQKLKPFHIQVNCIAPGGVLDKHSMTFRAKYIETGGVGMIETKNILPAIDLLLHKDNAINGQVITIDRGWSL
jgi:NAD(P)-dependent dehydrogenase (short-subunit alcohol dehydrogenase family)